MLPILPATALLSEYNVEKYTKSHTEEKSPLPVGSWGPPKIGVVQERAEEKEIGKFTNFPISKFSNARTLYKQRQASPNQPEKIERLYEEN
jgi:hypothetical protein